MKAVYIAEFGSVDNLELRDVPEPSQPGPTEVLVRVHAAGLNRSDLLQARGLYPPPDGYSPNIPGLEFAGEVVAIGDKVNDWKVGDRVFGITAGEAQAEYLRIDQSLLARIPDNLTFVEAGAVPEAFITAHDAIITQGKLNAGETLLIHAVGSGVGLAALQIAKTRGAFVIGTTRWGDKTHRAKAIGLDIALLIRDPKAFADSAKIWNDGKGVDFIFDLVGGAYFAENLSSLAMQGRLLLVGLVSGSTAEFDLRIALQKRATIIGTVLRPRSLEEKAAAVNGFVRDVVPLLESGRIKPNLDRAFAASDVAEAYTYLESNMSFGKVVLEFSSR